LPLQQLIRTLTTARQAQSYRARSLKTHLTLIHRLDERLLGLVDYPCNPSNPCTNSFLPARKNFWPQSAVPRVQNRRFHHEIKPKVRFPICRPSAAHLPFTRPNLPFICRPSATRLSKRNLAGLLLRAANAYTVASHRTRPARFLSAHCLLLTAFCRLATAYFPTTHSPPPAAQSETCCLYPPRSSPSMSPRAAARCRA
jgi:hypothetical protein